MSATVSSLNRTRCTVRQVQWVQESRPCDRCQRPARRVGTATRTAIDLALGGPILLAVTVSVHHCPACRHTCRSQPPFLRPAATDTNRVVAKAVRSVYRDGMAIRRVAARLARDFWGEPSEAMVRLWCTAHAAARDFDGEYLPWVVAACSGILCVDEVDQGKIAALLAVAPAAPEGDRLVA